jgi:hypothetical protein
MGQRARCTLCADCGETEAAASVLADASEQDCQEAEGWCVGEACGLPIPLPFEPITLEVRP